MFAAAIAGLALSLFTGCAAESDAPYDIYSAEQSDSGIQLEADEADLESEFAPDYVTYLSAMHVALQLFPIDGIQSDDEALKSGGDLMCGLAEQNRPMLADQTALVEADNGVALMYISTQAISAVNNLCPEHGDWLANEWLLSSPDVYGQFAGIVLFDDEFFFVDNTFTYIDDWEIGVDGSGYRVECADGTWSMSGGRQGACSHHGGLR